MVVPDIDIGDGAGGGTIDTVGNGGALLSFTIHEERDGRVFAEASVGVDNIIDTSHTHEATLSIRQTKPGVIRW